MAPSQNFEPIVRMLRKSETKVKCIVRYPITIIIISIVGAFCKLQNCQRKEYTLSNSLVRVNVFPRLCSSQSKLPAALPPRGRDES